MKNPVTNSNRGREAQRLTLKHPGLPQSRFARKEVA
jgi:hypothetical protein